VPTKSLLLTAPTSTVEEEYDFALLLYAVCAELEQDIFHHPTEEIIFSSIRERDPILAEKLDEITEQHERLYEKSKTLHRTLSSIETEFISLDKDKLIAECKHYINLLSSHMGIEEKFIFPFAAENLAEADWETIESKVKLVDDPMFSQKRKAEFAELYECVYAQ